VTRAECHFFKQRKSHLKKRPLSARFNSRVRGIDGFSSIPLHILFMNYLELETGYVYIALVLAIDDVISPFHSFWPSWPAAT
jgi:hypothetical protein